MTRDPCRSDLVVLPLESQVPANIGQNDDAHCLIGSAGMLSPQSRPFPRLSSHGLFRRAARQCRPADRVWGGDTKELQKVTTFAVAASSKPLAPEAARAFASWLASPKHRAKFAKAGLDYKAE
jgi:hypothetical protein